MADHPQGSRPRDPDQIRENLDRARDEVAASLLLLRDEVTARLDWRWVVRRRPLETVGAAFLIGLWIGWD